MKKVSTVNNSEYFGMQEIFDSLFLKSLKGEALPNLMEIVMKEENILLAFRNVKNIKGAYSKGVNKKNIQDIKKMSKDELVLQIRGRLNKYNPSPVKIIEVSNNVGEKRPFGIPTILDRIIQQSILQVIEPICEAKFYNRSNAYRPNRRVEHTLAQCYKMINQQRLYYVVNVNIKNIFENVNHNRLRKQIWNIGIKDKNLLSIISKILRSRVVNTKGETVSSNKGILQSGLLSPIFSNIALNDLDWWIDSQFENMKTKHDYVCTWQGRTKKSDFYRALRKTNLKEMFLVRHADNIRIFCRNYKDANNTYFAVAKWLKERLCLDIDLNSSSVINLITSNMPLLGFDIGTKLKSKSYVVESHISDKSLEKISISIRKSIKEIQHPKISRKQSVTDYNLKVFSFHEYYKFATHVAIDFKKISWSTDTRIKQRLKTSGLSRKGNITNEYIKKNYGKSKRLRFIDKSTPIVPIGFIKHKNPMYLRKTNQKYTVEGRRELDNNSSIDFKKVKNINNQTVGVNRAEYLDNKIIRYFNQRGKCFVLGRELLPEEIHCHHKKPYSISKDDSYDNLIIIHKDVHTLVHATREETILKYINLLKLNEKHVEKINKLRKIANLQEIII